MQIAVLGTGYVGLVTGTCLAESGNHVACIDIDADKVARLKQGTIPIYEPGLGELVKQNLEDGRLVFTTELAEAVRPAEVVLIGVGTPQGPDGAADLSALWTGIDQLAPHLGHDAIVAIKSTVPVGTNAETFRRLKERTGRECHVASNPEFLKEGAAVEDFIKPDRVVVGVRHAEVAERLKQLYAPFLRTEHPFLVMSPESAEMSKYVANAMLATKISFINAMSNLCEKMGADINDVRRGIGHDRRIGFAFLFPGAGYGGSCFPKDVRALAALFEANRLDPKFLRVVDAVNEDQKRVVWNKLVEHFGGKFTGTTIAVWGLSFKPRTDDVREAPALVLIDELLNAGAKVRVHDPEAMDNVKRTYNDRIVYSDTPYAALEGADALAIMTEWKQFLQPDFARMKAAMKSPVIFDGRNLYSADQLRASGLTYHSIGRATVS